MAPLIGITRCRTLADYEESIRRAGGEPHVLDAEHDTPESALRDLDGLLLTGGGDVNPAVYGEPRHPTTDEAEPGRDRFELALTERALGADLPILAICRGIQVLNVAAGGTLMQDIPSAVPGALPHAVKEPKFALAHDVWLTKDSRLAALMRERLQDQEELPVNSRHHQAIGRLAPGLEVAATAPDGVIEAVERPASKFCIGVQWHPENFWRTGEFRALFEAFIEACQK